MPGRGAAGAKPVHDFSDVGFWQVFAAAARKHEVSVHLYLHDDFIVMDGSCLIIEQCTGLKIENLTASAIKRIN